MTGEHIMEEYDVVIIGGGLAGLSAAFELADKRKKVILLEANDYLGGRTSSFHYNGMDVESGFHRVIGYHTELLDFLKRAGIQEKELLFWEREIEVRLKDSDRTAKFGVAPLFGPLKTMKGILANNRVISPADKASLIPFLLKGLKDYTENPKELDEVSVYEYAMAQGVSDEAFHTVVVPFSSGLYFLPPERYSAYVFFGLIAPGIPRGHKMRIGAFLGGMTEMMCDPIARSIERKGGEVQTGKKVERLSINEEGKVTGAITKAGESYTGKHIVLATTLQAAKKMLEPSFSDHPWFRPMFDLPVMPAVTFQIELSKRSLPKDMTTFGPRTSMASFAEQSRTTFRQSKGRLSIILAEPEKYLGQDPEMTLKDVVADARSLGMDIEDSILDYRQIDHHYDFHSLEPGNNWMRPGQKTPVEGLILAGDYTRQPFFATMQGAVVSGGKAAEAILDSGK